MLTLYIYCAKCTLRETIGRWLLEKGIIVASWYCSSFIGPEISKEPTIGLNPEPNESSASLYQYLLKISFNVTLHLGLLCRSSLSFGFPN